MVNGYANRQMFDQMPQWNYYSSNTFFGLVDQRQEQFKIADENFILQSQFYKVKLSLSLTFNNTSSRILNHLPEMNRVFDAMSTQHDLTEFPFSATLVVVSLFNR